MENEQSKKRLLMISTDRKIFEVGSAVRARQIEHAKGWEEVHIVVFSKRNHQEPITNIQSEISISPNCFIYSTRSRFKLRYPFDAIRLGRFIIERRGITDITCQDSSLTAMAGVALKREFDAKKPGSINLEIQIHEDIGSPYYGFDFTNRIRKTLALKYIPHADRIRVVSERIKGFLIDALKVEAAKIEVRPIRVDTEWIKSAPVIPTADLHMKYPQFDKIVLTAGRLEPEKNFKLAVDSWPLVLKSQPKAGLVIVGEGNQTSHLRSLVSKLGIGQSVAFESWADQKTLVSYYKTADLFLNTSIFEGYGMTLVEAQAAGSKIISTDVGVAREIGATIVDYNAEKVAQSIVSALI